MSTSTNGNAPLWIYPKIDPTWSRKIVEELHIHPVTAQILVSRGYHRFDAIQELLYSKLPDLLDPFLMADMRTAVQRICEAIEQQERILILGDNDVDGMTGAALLTEFLAKVNAEVISHIPNRDDASRGLMTEALEHAHKMECKLVITVDCGITAAKEIAIVAERGIDVIITDHHEPTAKLPLCVATLNPKLVNNTYPNRELTGVGVAFKLIHALTNELTRTRKLTHNQVNLKDFLDLVALGTVADMGALQGENRILVRYGLKQLASTNRIGLRKLFEVCELNGPTISAMDIASKIAPRLNSLGRIADPKKGVELLLIRDPDEAEKLANELDLNNIERQKIEQVMSEDVHEQLEKHPEILNEKAIVMSSDKWHPGIIPIVTTRISKQYNRPTLMIAITDGIGKGSIRTIREFPLLPILKENADLLLNFGGHDYAAGLSIDADKIPEFRQKFINRANAELREQDVISKLEIDAQADFELITFDFMESLALLEPFGNDNPSPLLYCDATQVRPPRVVGTNHLKFYLSQGDRQLEGIAFGMADRKEQLYQRGKELRLRVAFTPQVNTFHNKPSIQLLIRDFKVL